MHWLRGIPLLSIMDSFEMLINSRLHRYLAEVAHVDIYWFIGSRLDQISAGQLPKIDETLTGSSVVPYRYHFNTGMSLFSTSSLAQN